MTLFDDAFKYVMGWEGGSKVTKDPVDPGGVTKYGISAKAHPGVDIENLTEAEAKQIYEQEYWNPLGCNDIQGVKAIKLFDAGVNVGRVMAAILAQQAYNDVKRPEDPGLETDGIVGYHTVEALKAVEQEPWLEAFVDRLTLYYYYLVNKKPELARFIKGWTRRADTIPEVVP